MSKIKSLFLGPSAENLDLFRKLVDDVLLDAAFLRRNYHPEDESLITERDKIEPDFSESTTQMRQSLLTILADLKKSVPTYHPRHVGHMNADVFMTGIAGFLGGMMYNPNNIINVASPSSTDREVDYMNQLCQMVGYAPVETSKDAGKIGSWGHLCSGGTSANIEALWVLRNLKYYPVTLKLAAKKIPALKRLTINSSPGKTIGASSFQDLLNLSVDDIYALISKVNSLAYKGNDKEKEEKAKNTSKAIEENSVQQLGVAGIHKIIADREGVEINPPKVYISHTCHYSWEKAMDVIGLGGKNLEKVKTNTNFQLDKGALRAAIQKKPQSPILAVVDIMGTTEEGVFDPLEEILALRAEEGNRFFVHVDGAYGGYFASFLNGRKKGESITAYLDHIAQKETGSANLPDWKMHFTFDETWVRRVEALRDADSITIDPHKLGYIPYPAGAILFKDSRTRQVTRFEAPYVSGKGAEGRSDIIYLGQWTLEGSRPGAAAVACSYSAEVLPLDAEHHGRLLACTVISAAKLFQAIDEFNKRENPYGFTIVPLFKTDSNCVCYIVANKEFIKSPTLLNQFTRAIDNELTIHPGGKIIPDYDYIISTSDWSYENYEECIKRILAEEAGIDESRLSEMKGEELHYIRSVMMNPLAAYEKDDFFDKYVNHLGSILTKTLTRVLSERIFERPDGKNKRYRILWVENETEEMEKQKDRILKDPDVGYSLDINFVDYNCSTQDEVLEKMDTVDAIIVDMNLVNETHKDDPRTVWAPCFDLLQEIWKKDPKKTVCVCSEYLSKQSRFYNRARSRLLDPAMKPKFKEANLIPKNRITSNKNSTSEKSPLDFDGNKLLLMNSIFSLLKLEPENKPI